MRFLSPKIDYVFKKVFGSEQSTDILISFLNAVIYHGENEIQSLTIVNPYNPSQIMTLKESYLDIKAVLSDQSIVMIEMQMSPMTAFSKRVVYNMAKGYANQLKKADNYILLNPVIAVTIADFILFSQTEAVMNEFIFKEKTKNFTCVDEELKLIFLELPKFKKPLSELKTLADKWIYFLKEAQGLEDIPNSLGEVSEIEVALTMANEAGMNLQELEAVEARATFLRDERARVMYAIEEARELGLELGREEGLAQGREQGREEGLAQGREQGQKAQALSLILRLINKRFGEISVSLNQQLEGLTLEALERLGDNFLEFETREDLVNWLSHFSEQ
ncbi:MAG: Rpn family recombination-promoting nuclease/putative transposase [Microcystaceae cyanobacterium]